MSTSSAVTSRSSANKRISVTVFSDLACPWCYVGQKKLNAAVATFQQKSSTKPPISVVWKPYIIDPNTQTDGEEFEAYNIRRWGSSGWTNGLKRSGRTLGANFTNWQTWPNTLKAHQLIAYVTNPERQRLLLANANDSNELAVLPSTAECNAAIFHAMYENGENISLVPTLLNIGREACGILEHEVADLRIHLENNTGAKDVMKEIQGGRRRFAIQGVPYFIVGATTVEDSCANYLEEPYSFSGAQDPSAFVEIFEELEASLIL